MKVGLKGAKFKILGLVPARGGSKGIPRKNIRLLNNKPLLAYSIEHGKESKYIDRVVCSTEDEEIAEIASKCGAEVPFIRPEKFSSNDANDSGFTKHTIEWLRDNQDWIPDIVAILRPTSPLRSPKELDESIELLINNPDAHSVISVKHAEKTPYKMWKRTNTKFVVPLLNSNIFDQNNAARQLLPEVLVPTGAIHNVWSSIVLRDASVLGYKVLPFEDIISSCIDIDCEEDFKKAELYLENLKK